VKPAGADAFTVYVGDGEQHAGAVERLADVPVLAREKGRYLADRELAEAVNIALCVGQPLLLTGEPGCGKTRLAWSIAEELDLGDVLQFYTRSTSRAQDLLYRFDAVQRFHDIQAGNKEKAGRAIEYVRWEALGRAIVEGRRRVVLVDEVDKAPRDFPNDLLNELDKMWFEVPELDDAERVKRSTVRPIVVITSNSERQLPLPFLRRCVFHHIQFPTEAKLVQILRERLQDIDLDGKLIEAAVGKFRQVREVRGLTKLPATGELLTWVHALHVRGVAAEALQRASLGALPLWQALLKDRDDLRRVQEA
jgi:MoxR-like ATPase